MALTYVMLITFIPLIFVNGIVFYAVLKSNKDNGPLIIVPVIGTGMLFMAILLRIEKETVPIHSASVHQAIVLCETNGGLKMLDQREAVCENGVAFNTRSLKKPEKE